MARNILIGLGAGLAAALLFAALISGTTLAFPLFILSPLPIAIAGLGFGTYSGAAAAAVASVLIGLFIGNIAGGLYFVLFAGPIAVTAHWIGLSRPVEDTADKREWFPLDKVLFRLAVAVGVAVILVGVLLRYDPAVLVAQTLSIINDWLKQDASGGAAPSQAELEPFVRFNIALMPYSSASFALVVLVFDTWLAARIVKMSGLLTRPWIPLWTVTLPQPMAMLFAIALVISLTPGALGQAAGALAGATGFAFALSGYGLLHAMLLGRGLRPLVLIAVYTISAVFLLPVALMAIAGLADTFFHFRGRRLPAPKGSN
jgi:hypothetical protein